MAYIQWLNELQFVGSFSLHLNYQLNIIACQELEY